MPKIVWSSGEDGADAEQGKRQLHTTTSLVELFDAEMTGAEHPAGLLCSLHYPAMVLLLSSCYAGVHAWHTNCVEWMQGA